MTRRPDLFIIGAAKCGTTSIHEYLKGHPEVFMSPRKEPRYFAPDLMTGLPGKDLQHGKDLDRYLDLFRDAHDEKRLGEASVRYIYSREAAGLIRAFEPNAYIVAMIRNPVDMVFSLHAHRVAGGAEDIPDFEEALAAEEDRRQGRRLPPHSIPEVNQYRARAKFGEQLPRWFEAFGRERVHVIVFEDFVRQPAAEFRRLLEFLDVDPDYQPASFSARNPRHEPKSQALRAVLRSRIPQWMVWTALPRVVGESNAHRLLKPFKRMNFKPVPKVSMRPELRRQLEGEFAPDVALVSQLLGRDLGELWFKRREDASPPKGEPVLSR